MIEGRLSLAGLTFAAITHELKDHVFTITLNRPHRKNAINEAMTTELLYAIDYARQERGVRVVVLAAAGDVFCAGGDLKDMAGQREQVPVSGVPRRGEIDDFVVRLYHLNKPVVAKVQGPALAGALLMVCNATHVIAAESTFFAAPEIRRGMWPFQVMAGLFRVMPKRAALDFLMRGYRLDAAEAARLGLINKVVSADMLDAEVAALATELAGLAPGTMRAGLAAFRAQEEMRFDEALPYLRSQFEACLSSDDAREGIAAFLEKRAPNWK